MALQQRWLRIVPVALIMYTISYVDRTNVALALDPQISTMMRDLLMDDRMKGEAAGIFFFGYLMLQLPGGYLASRGSPRRLISLLLVAWGVCAAGCGLAHTFRQFEVMRFLLGVAESGVFPATLVLLANWFPESERARANSYWHLCQPLGLVVSAPVTAWLLGRCGWQQVLILEGLLPFVWLPIWWFGVRDHPHEAPWVSSQERAYLEKALREEASALQPARRVSLLDHCLKPAVLCMIIMYFLHNCAAYGCMSFFTNTLTRGRFSPLEHGVLFALPYALTAVLMILNSWHSDKTRERRAHVGVVYLFSGVCLILSVLIGHFWISYALLCLAIPGPFVAMGPFWAIPSETLPREAVGLVIGVVNACGNLGGFAGPYIVGWLSTIYHSTAVPFGVLGIGTIICAALAVLLPKRSQPASPVLEPASKVTLRSCP